MKRNDIPILTTSHYISYDSLLNIKEELNNKISKEDLMDKCIHDRLEKCLNAYSEELDAAIDPVIAEIDNMSFEDLSKNMRKVMKSSKISTEKLCNYAIRIIEALEE